MARRLYRSRSERIISGVCGGLGQYFNVDPVLVRVVFVLLALASGIGIVAYIVLWIIAPVEGTTATKAEDIVKENIKEAADTAADIGERIRDTFRPEHKAEEGAEQKEEKAQPAAVDRGRYIAGIILVIVGLLILLANFQLLWWFAWGKLWPILLIIIGLVMIVGMARRSSHD